MLALLGNNSAGMESIFVKERVHGRMHYIGYKRMGWGLQFVPVPMKFAVGLTGDCYRWVPGQAAQSVPRTPPGCSLWSLQTPPH